MGAAVVEAYSGYTYGECPRFFHWQGERLEVAGIQSRWRSPGERGWRAEVHDGRSFDITYLEHEDEWVVRRR